MNFFQKNRIILWVLTGLLIAALSALGTLAYHHWSPSAPSASSPSCGNRCDFLSEELGLSAAQKEKVGEIRMVCREKGMEISDSLRAMRNELMTVLSNEEPDTVRLRAIAGRIGQFQEQLTNRTIDQYLRISRVCTPEQREKLSSLYSEMMGCCKHGKCEGGPCKCPGK